MEGLIGRPNLFIGVTWFVEVFGVETGGLLSVFVLAESREFNVGTAGAVVAFESGLGAAAG